jgi:hypothetical protein
MSSEKRYATGCYVEGNLPHSVADTPDIVTLRSINTVSTSLLSSTHYFGFRFQNTSNDVISVNIPDQILTPEIWLSFRSPAGNIAISFFDVIITPNNNVKVPSVRLSAGQSVTLKFDIATPIDDLKNEYNFDVLNCLWYKMDLSHFKQANPDILDKIYIRDSVVVWSDLATVTRHTPPYNHVSDFIWLIIAIAGVVVVFSSLQNFLV